MIDIDVEQQLGTFRLAVAFQAQAPIVGLFGRSGAGKTSLVNAIAGISRPRRGSINIDGNCLFDDSRGVDLAPEARRIGYVFQDALLFPHLDVQANLLYGYRRRRHGEVFIETQRVVDLLGIGPLLHRRPAALSGGEKQRVAIGRALLAQPRIMLLDEPLASLDLARKAEIMDYIERLRRELRIPMIYVSHSIAEITRLADTVVLLSEGRCVAVGNTAEVMQEAGLTTLDDDDEVGSVIETRVGAHDRVEALTRLVFDGGELVVPLLDHATGQRVRVRIRPRDVTLALARPSEISVLNILPGRVRSVRENGACAHVGIAVGSVRLTATITRHSLRALSLEPGRTVYALVKAVSFERPGIGRV
ncbi:MAG TPA: molybdenum ABC transporter ATP-binding protein [Casimicrobiaceae bacterium]|jgi:molybdate transport system ATP-binding protein